MPESRWVIIDDVVMTESYYLLLFVVGYEQAADLGIWRTGEDIDLMLLQSTITSKNLIPVKRDKLLERLHESYAPRAFFN